MRTRSQDLRAMGTLLSRYVPTHCEQSKSTKNSLHFIDSPDRRAADPASFEPLHARHAPPPQVSTMNRELEHELELLGQSLKRKRRISDSGSEARGRRTPSPPSFSAAEARQDSVIGDSFENPIEILGDSFARPIEIDDDDEGPVGGGVLLVPAAPRNIGGFPVLRLQDPNFAPYKMRVEDVTGYTFKRSELLLEALYPYKCPVVVGGRLVHSGNWRLALLGDAVLKTALVDSRIVVDETSGKFRRAIKLICRESAGLVTEWITGATAQYAQRYLTNVALAQVALRHGLQPSNQASSAKALGTLIEAIIGAIWIDSDKDLDTVKSALEGLYGVPLG